MLLYVPALAVALLLLLGIARVIKNYRNGGDAYKLEVESRRRSREATHYVGHGVFIAGDGERPDQQPSPTDNTT